MKKICAILGFLIVSNATAQLFNLAAVLAGNTNDVICYVTGSPGEPTSFQAITCDNKAGLPTGRLILGKQASEGAIMAGFVGSGRWDLATNYVGKNNTTIFIFTKK